MAFAFFRIQDGGALSNIIPAAEFRKV